MNAEIIHRYGNLSPVNILRFLLNDIFFQILPEEKSWTFIILGRPGATGKTWLCNHLKTHGFDACEISESIASLVDYRGRTNRVIKNDIDRTIVIVLNEPLSI